MTNVACFCGCFYSFDRGEGTCPRCGAVAAVKTRAIRNTSENREQNEQNEPDAATADGTLPARTPLPSGR
jgi:hypothetical protein